MKRIILLRHAKALPSTGEPDRDRPLAPRGIADALAAARAIAAGGWRPDLALVSESRRTRETIARVAPALDPGLQVRFEPGLYDAGSAEILALVGATSDAVDTLLVVGHNPGLGEAARRLATHGARDDLGRLHERFPTSCVAVVALTAPRWPEIDRGGTLEAVLWLDPTGQAE